MAEVGDGIEQDVGAGDAQADVQDEDVARFDDGVAASDQKRVL